MIPSILFFLLIFLCLSLAEEEPLPRTCSVSQHDGRENALDPNLHEMTYDVGDGPRKTMVYIEPDISTFYEGSSSTKKKLTPEFAGMSGKFINMSTKRVTFSWEREAGGEQYEMNHMGPFGATGTSTYPSHSFVFTEEGKPDKVLIRFEVEDYPNNVYYYDPYLVEGDPEQTEKNLAVLNKEEREKYDGWRKTVLFNKQYLAKTGRSYLANYLRSPPIHYMWPADYFGQKHWVTTKETHFVEKPPSDKLKPMEEQGIKRRLNDDEPRLLHEYRKADEKTMNMTMKVLSVAPRVYEIPNFLSPVEVEHVLELAAGIKLSLSSTGDYEEGKTAVEEDDNRRTRTSYNSWVPREKSPIIDAIYRRAADLMRIDEAMFRQRSEGELQDMRTQSTVAEDLQLVHYKVDQEYTEHHDFGFTRIDNKIQGERFATLLLYLNSVPKGGETSFPRWVNAATSKALKVVPDTPGKAVLFYSQLPDGNFDDFSQHAALPVIKGEKWLINLWVHSPEKQ